MEPVPTTPQNDPAVAVPQPQPQPLPAAPLQPTQPQLPPAPQTPLVTTPLPAQPSMTAPQPFPVAPAQPTQPQLPPDPQPVYYQAAPVKPAKRFPTWLKITGIVVALLILFVVGVSTLANQGTKDAVKVSDQLVTDIQTNNGSDAYSLTTPEFKKTATEAELSQMISKFSPSLQGTAKATGKAINKSSGKASLAVIVYTIKTTDGNKYLRVVLEDNTPWQVLNFRSSDTALDTSAAN